MLFAEHGVLQKILFLNKSTIKTTKIKEVL